MGAILNLLISHRVPLKPFGHVHTKPLYLSVHTAPFLQGFGLQSSLSVDQRKCAVKLLCEQISRLTRIPTLWYPKRFDMKPSSTSIEDGYRLVFSDLEGRSIVLFV